MPGGLCGDWSWGGRRSIRNDRGVRSLLLLVTMMAVACNGAVSRHASDASAPDECAPVFDASMDAARDGEAASSPPVDAGADVEDATIGDGGPGCVLGGPCSYKHSCSSVSGCDKCECVDGSWWACPEPRFDTGDPCTTLPGLSCGELLGAVRATDRWTASASRATGPATPRVPATSSGDRLVLPRAACADARGYPLAAMYGLWRVGADLHHLLRGGAARTAPEALGDVPFANACSSPADARTDDAGRPRDCHALHARTRVGVLGTGARGVGCGTRAHARVGCAVAHRA
jgi:hypothetical protein